MSHIAYTVITYQNIAHTRVQKSVTETSLLITSPNMTLVRIMMKAMMLYVMTLTGQRL